MTVPQNIVELCCGQCTNDAYDWYRAQHDDDDMSTVEREDRRNSAVESEDRRNSGGPT